MKALSPGRIVIINTSSSSNVLGVVLKSSTTGSNNERLYTVFSICDKIDTESGKNSSWNSSKSSNSSDIGDCLKSADVIKPVTKMKLFQPEGVCWHEIVQCRTEQIAVVTTRTIRIDAEKIINDVKKREQSRFRYVSLNHSHSKSQGRPFEFYWQLHFCREIKFTLSIPT